MMRHKQWYDQTMVYTGQSRYIGNSFKL